MRKIQIVSLSKMEEMRKHFYEYLTELSAYDSTIIFDKNGLPVYKWYDCYWEDKNRYPIYFIIDNSVAGLAMVRQLDNMLYEIAEFYVLPKYREKGNAVYFAKEITNLFDGEFVFSTRFANERAMKFWGKFAKLFERNEFSDDGVWRKWTIRKTNFKTHALSLNIVYFDLIKCGKKVLEGRLNDDKRKQFNVGDKITFYKEPEKTETINAIILDKYFFKSFDDMAKKLNKENLGFADKSEEDMIKIYRSIYSIDDENKFGVVVFKIKLL